MQNINHPPNNKFHHFPLNKKTETLLVDFINIYHLQSTIKKEENKEEIKMTKSGAIILISSVVCLFSLIGITQAQAQAQAQFHVEGKVYCDFCRALFENRLSKPMAGIFYFLSSILYVNIFFNSYKNENNKVQENDV